MSAPVTHQCWCESHKQINVVRHIIELHTVAEPCGGVRLMLHVDSYVNRGSNFSLFVMPCELLTSAPISRILPAPVFS